MKTFYLIRWKNKPECLIKDGRHTSEKSARLKYEALLKEITKTMATANKWPKIINPDNPRNLELVKVTETRLKRRRK